MSLADEVKGMWRAGQAFNQLDQHTAIETGWYAGAPFISYGVASSVRTVPIGGQPDAAIVLQVRRPGMHTLYFSAYNGRVIWGEHLWPLQRQARMMGMKTPVKQVMAGQLIVTNGVEIKTFDAEPARTVKVLDGLSLDQCIEELQGIFFEATREMYDVAGQPKVTCLLSGGTDSTLGAIALKQIDADVHCVSVGRTPDEFDARYAADYARQLGLPFTFIALPTSDADLNQLAWDAVSTSENSEMSNTMMAMCTTLVRRWALANDRPCLWKGHYADDLLGTNNATYGTFKKKFPMQTDQEWSDYRASLYQHVLPNDMQVAQVSRRDGAFWRSTFYHPKVADFVWACPIEAVPIRLRKPLFGGLCDRFVHDGSWCVDTKKVGYYTGSGIGKIRLDNPVLGDDNFRRLYKLAKEQLS